MSILYEDNDFKITCSETNFKKWVIFCPSAAGLDRVTLTGVIKDPAKKDPILNGIYTSSGINEINFISKSAHWYQRPGVSDCIEVLKKTIKWCEDDCVIYGASMGGFGAIHFGGELGIASVAFSPQATLEEDFDITENWIKISEYAKYHYGKFKSNITDGRCLKAPIYMFYDGSHVLDRKHASYIIRNYSNCISFNIPYGGHACSGSVNRIYKIKQIITEVINHEFTVDKFKNYFFLNYRKDAQRVESAWSRFKYLSVIVPDHDFYIRLGMLRGKNFFNLCAGVCRILETYFPKYLEQCLSCLVSDRKILKCISNMGRMGEADRLLENSYLRKKVCALFYQNRKRFADAESLYRITYEFDKYSIEIAGNLALVIQKQGRFKEALDILFKHIELNGRNEQNMLFLAKLYFSNRDFNNARKWLLLSFSHTLFSGKNITAENYLLYARTFREEGRIKEAVSYLNDKLYIGRESGEYLAHLGAFLIMIGHHQNGLEFLQQAKQRKKYPIWTDDWINKAENHLAIKYHL